MNTLAKAPSFEKGQWPDFNDQKWVTAIEQFYRPYLAKQKENGRTLDVQVDTGKTKVKVEGSKKRDEKRRRLDVDVEHHPSHKPGDRDKWPEPLARHVGPSRITQAIFVVSRQG